MRIYLDDNITDRRVVRELRQSEHDVVLPGAVGHSGVSDAKHLAYAIRHSYVPLTQNSQDFLDRHDLIVTAGGHHPGLLLLYSDNDPRRDMTPRSIATALTRLEAAVVPFEHHVYVVNHWR